MVNQNISGLGVLTSNNAGVAVIRLTVLLKTRTHSTRNIKTTL